MELDFNAMNQAAMRSALEAQKRPGMIKLPDGIWYDYKSNIEDYLTSQCAMLADQNLCIEAQTLYDIQPDPPHCRYSLQQIQAWLDRHPQYAAGRY